MNGKDWDVELDGYNEARELLDKDAEAFCRCVSRLQSATGLYNLINSKEIETLEERIHTGNYDLEAIKAAKYLFNENYNHYKAGLIQKVNNYANRVKKEMLSYKHKGDALTIIFQLLQFIAIVGAATVAFTINIPQISKIIPTIISALVTVAATLTKYYKFKDRCKAQYLAYKKLQKEYDLYLSERGPYSLLKLGAAHDLFMDRIDEINEEIARLFTSFDEKVTQERDKELEPIKMIRESPGT